MKKLGAIALAALAMASTSAMAQGTHNVGNFGPGYPGYGNGAGLAFNANVGIPNDTSAATTTVSTAFTLTGTVNKDCSYFNANSGSHTIPLGTIGVRNSNNEAPSQLFNQVSDFSIEITSTSAGCNFANTVSVDKSNGAQGLLNSAPGGYDSNSFTANIPYIARIGISQATTNTTAPAPGQYQTFQAETNEGGKSKAFGAFRSAIFLHAIVPAQTKGLVAGTYSDTVTVTLTAS